jgi:hypothetical protein
VVLAHNLPADAQFQTGAAPCRWTGEIRLKDGRELFRGDEGAIVVDIHLYAGW